MREEKPPSIFPVPASRLTMAAIQVQPILGNPHVEQSELSPILSTDAVSQDISRDSEDQSPSTNRTSSTPNSEISTTEVLPIPKEEYFTSSVNLKAKARAKAEDLSLKEQVRMIC